MVRGPWCVRRCRFSYTFESTDLRVARAHFDRLASEFSCSQFVTQVRGGASLVVKDPGQAPPCKYGNIGTGACVYKDLIDWPNTRDSLVANGSSPDASCCRDGYVMNAASAPINAHVPTSGQSLPRLWPSGQLAETRLGCTVLDLAITFLFSDCCYSRRVLTHQLAGRNRFGRRTHSSRGLRRRSAGHQRRPAITPRRQPRSKPGSWPISTAQLALATLQSVRALLME